jgi:hypothetical protein
VTLFEITSGERALWQRQAVGELTAILDTQRDLPLIAWTVASAGAALLGRVNGLVPAAQARATFEMWRSALALTERAEVSSGAGITDLRAVAHRNRVHIGLSATILDDECRG